MRQIGARATWGTLSSGKLVRNGWLELVRGTMVLEAPVAGM